MNINPTNALIILNGGVEIGVNFADGHKETVKVRQLPIKSFPKLAEAFVDEIELLKLVCEKDDAWVESLDYESHSKLVEEAERLNHSRFFPWMERRSRTNQALAETLRKLSPSLISAGGSAPS